MAQGNVSYQKTDFGAETPDLFQYYVRKLAQIADIPIRDGIDKDTLKEALDIVGAEAAITLLQKTLATETSERQSADTALSGRVDGLSTAIANEIQARVVAISSETADRTAENTALRQLITALQEIAHTHGNKELLDAISDERVAGWDRAATDGHLEAFTDFKDFVQDAFMGIVNQFRDIYNAVGFQAYNGSYFGAVYDGAHLNGGSFMDREIGKKVDGGDFSQRKITEFATTEEIIAEWNKEDE